MKSQRLPDTEFEIMTYIWDREPPVTTTMVMEALGLPMPGLHIAIRAEIPICRGLGSSSSLLAAGAIAANALHGGVLSEQEVLTLCTSFEGHPDNLAPCLLGGMTASMKTFYDTELLENARPELIHTQFARKQALPAGRGKTVEWRKWNTLEDAGALTEGVIPTGQKFGQSAVTQAITQYGTYVSVSDQLELHAIDDVILGAAEELGASAGTTQDKLVRNVAAAGTNVQYCDKVGTNGAHTAVTSRAGLDTTAKLTPDEVNKAVTLLKKLKAPKIDGKYIAIIHPSVAYDLRSSEAWIEAHKYAGLTELFTGEIGELHGVRFIETTEAKIFNGEGCPVKTAADTSKGTPAEYYSVYATLFLGKDAYGMIDPEGGNLEMIIKDKGQVGGPLNQFSTLGYKFSSAAKILYEDRMVRVESCGAYSAEDEAN